MKAAANIMVFALVTFLLVINAPASQFVGDAEIERDVLWTLQTDPYLGEDRIKVRVRNGIVFLSGHVTTPWERARAAELARNVNGVLSVENNLVYSDFRGDTLTW